MSLLGLSGRNPEVSLLHSCTIPCQIQLFWKKEGTFIFLFRKKKGGKHPKKQESGHSCTNIQSKMFMGISSSHAHTSSRKINDRGAEQVGFFFPEQGA